MAILQEISENLQKGYAPKVTELVKQALNNKLDPLQILNDGLINGMNIVGVKFRNNEIYVPEVLIAARAMYAGLNILRPILTQTGATYVGRVVIGTVKGDIHDIGKNLVKMMMEGAGFEVIDLGVDVSPEKFVDAVKNYKPDILGMSALLTTTMLNMKDTIEALKSENLRDKVVVMVGGAAVTESYAVEIGANGYARDSVSAVERAKELVLNYK
ncbi:MAG: corrinoid protein [Thermotogae bacterium]|jgi:5-methyltetrahydrofolate--homocysteine methyltransferase|nr:corrinoid protein [Thermotogota bacterium]MCL5032376.1 corrinoid protein [Thermotogota bacterium]